MPSDPTELRSFRYRAFISYSHRDSDIVGWLHRRIEEYVVPKSLVGTGGRDGPLPRRIKPVFRDRDELPASADLGATLRQALEESAVLLVVCSPAAAASRWVNEEVLAFKRLGRSSRVFAVIAGGEPHGELDECFPPALRFQLDAAGELTTVPAEPIAPDLRPGGDGRERVKIKLIAGILGVPFDLLFDREQRRQKRRRRLSVVAVLLLAAAFAGTWYWRDQIGERQLRRQRSEAAARLAEEGRERERQKVRFQASDAAETGRRALIAGDPALAEPALTRANRLLPDDPATRLMLELARNDTAGLKGIWSGHVGGVLHLASQPQGSLALSIGEDGTAIIWKVEDGTIIHRIGETASIGSGLVTGQFSQDGKWAVVTRSYGAESILVEVASGKQRSLPGAAAAMFVADGRLAVVAKTDGGFSWVDPLTGARSPGAHLPSSCEGVRALDRDGHTAVLFSQGGRDWHYLWVDLATGRVLADLPDVRGNDTGPALSPDGTRLAVATREGFVIHDAQGAVVGKLSGLQPIGEQMTAGIVPYSLQWAANGRLLVSANQGSTRSVWSAEGKLLRMLPCPGMDTLVANPDDALAAFTAEDGRVEIWDLDSGELRSAFTDTIGPLGTRSMISAQTASVHFVRHSPLLLSAYNSRQVKCWAWQDTRSSVRELRRHRDQITSLCWSHDSRTLASSGSDGRVVLWDANAGKMRVELAVATELMGGVAGTVIEADRLYSTDGRGIPSAWLNEGRAIPLLPSESAQALEARAQFESELALLSDTISDRFASGGLPPLVVEGRLLTCARGEREICVHNLQQVSFGPALALENGRIRDFTVSGKMVLLGDDSGGVTGVELETGKRVFAVKTSQKPLRSVRASRDGRLFAARDADGKVRVFALPGGTAMPSASNIDDNKVINDFVFSADGTELFLACEDGTLARKPLIDGRAPSLLSDVTRPSPDTMPPDVPGFGSRTSRGVIALALSADGRWVAASFDYGVSCLWEASTGRQLYRFTTRRAECIAFSPNNQWLALGNQAGAVWLVGLVR